MATVSSFKGIENKHAIYRGIDCMKKFCETLREHAIKIINFKQEKIQGINKPNSRNHMKRQKSTTFPNKNLRINMLKTKNIGDLLHTGKYRSAAHSICNLKYSVPNEIPIVSSLI